MKPLIGITANYIKDGKFAVDAHIGGTGQCWQALADDYVESVFRAGGIPVILPVVADPKEAVEWLDRLDGILFTGGCDLSPLTYGERVTSKVGEICQERDDMELVLAKAALARPGYPIFCICRGCQLLKNAWHPRCYLLCLRRLALFYQCDSRRRPFARYWYSFRPV